MLRKIVVVSRLDHVKNEMVRERLRLEPVLKKAERRREYICGRRSWRAGREFKCGGKVMTGEGIGKRPCKRTPQEDMERSLLRHLNVNYIWAL